MIIKDWKKDLFTIPNALSLFRLLLIPVYILIYLRAAQTGENSDFFLAAAILAVSCLTDLIDGKVARAWNMMSTTGKILDPLADKVTQLTLIICLTVRYPILLALIILFVIKESFQLIAGIIAFRKGEMLTGALMSGKICTTILFVSLIALVLIPNISSTAVAIITALDAAAMVVSFFGYARAYYKHSPMIQSLDSGNNE